MNNIARWRVFTLDVWGNPTDGYEVNDRSERGHVDLPSDATDEAIVSALIARGILNATVKATDVEVGGDDGILMIDIAEDGCPLFQLEREEGPVSL